MLLADIGRLDMEEPMFGKAVDAQALEVQVAELESMLKQAQGGEVSCPIRRYDESYTSAPFIFEFSG